MRVDSGEVELAGDQEDDGPDDASACRIGHNGQRTDCRPALRVRCAGLRPPLTPGDSQNIIESTHLEVIRAMGKPVEMRVYSALVVAGRSGR
jgi:hypothetical protein